VIRRVRALAKKTEIEPVPLDVNDVVREVVALVQRELTSHQVIFADGVCTSSTRGPGRSGPTAAGDYQPGDEWH